MSGASNTMVLNTETDTLLKGARIEREYHTSWYCTCNTCDVSTELPRILVPALAPYILLDYSLILNCDGKLTHGNLWQ